MSQPPPNRELGRIQKWMHAVITNPTGVASGIASDEARAEIDIAPPNIESVILPSKALNSFARLDVYANAYYARLLECLRNEFPAAVAALTEDTFNGFALDYLQQHPSQSYTLTMLGRNFSRYLADTRPARTEDAPDWADFLIELADLEFCYSDVFDGPGIENEPALSPTVLTDIPEQRWPDCRLIAAPCVRLKSFRYPVHDYVSAVRRGVETPIPQPRDICLVITRRDFVIRRYEIDRDQFDLLQHLVEGQTVGDAIAAHVARHLERTDQLGTALHDWFRQWAEWRLFLRAE